MGNLGNNFNFKYCCHFINNFLNDFVYVRKWEQCLKKIAHPLWLDKPINRLVHFLLLMPASPGIHLKDNFFFAIFYLKN